MLQKQKKIYQKLSMKRDIETFEFNLNIKITLLLKAQNILDTNFDQN